VVRAALLVVALVFTFACRTVPSALPLPADDPRPAALLARWEAEIAARAGLRGRAHVAVASEAGRYSSRQVVVLERPARLRVEVLGLMKQTAAVITTDGDRFEVFRVGDRSYETGSVRPDLLWREARLALLPTEAIAVLLGVPVPGADLTLANAMRTHEDWIEVDLVDREGHCRQRASFDASERLRSFEVLGDDGSSRWRARFDGYALVGASQLPHAIVLDVAEGGTHAEIELKDLELTPVLSTELFRLRAPVDAGAIEGEGG
jgi:outer membrane lipoprotein-sorting protein